MWWSHVTCNSLEKANLHHLLTPWPRQFTYPFRAWASLTGSGNNICPQGCCHHLVRPWLWKCQQGQAPRNSQLSQSLSLNGAGLEAGLKRKKDLGSTDSVLFLDPSSPSEGAIYSRSVYLSECILYFHPRFIKSPFEQKEEDKGDKTPALGEPPKWRREAVPAQGVPSWWGPGRLTCDTTVPSSTDTEMPPRELRTSVYSVHSHVLIVIHLFIYFSRHGSLLWK